MPGCLGSELWRFLEDFWFLVFFFVTDLVGECSHTPLQVELVRTCLHLKRQDHPKDLFHTTAYSDAVAGEGRPAGSGPGAGAGKDLPKVSPACSPSVVGRQRQGVSMATIMLIKEHCQFYEPRLGWRSGSWGKDWHVCGKLERTERLSD